MPTARIHPGIHLEEVSSGARAITGVETSITVLVGWAPRGPTGRAQSIGSFADYQRTFGGLDSRSFLGHAVQHFYDNGGSAACIVRLVGANATAAGAMHGTLSFVAASAGQWANGFAVRTTRSRLAGDRFQLDVLDITNGSAVVESYQNLSIDPGDPQALYVEAMVNARSELLSVTTIGPTAPVDGTIALSGGNDGAVLLPGSDAFHAALARAFEENAIIEDLDLVNLVCVPGESDATTLAMLQGWCRKHRAFLIADTDQAATVQSLSEGTTAVPMGPDALNSAVFFPWVRAPDPLQGGMLASFPPSGFIAGVFARIDAARGVWTAPAGKDALLNGAAGLAVEINEAQNSQLNPKAINCLRTFPPYGNVVWGSRTLHGQDERGSEWKFIPVRRTALFLEETLSRGIQWAAFEPNDETLWSQIRKSVGDFMHGLFREGAFQGSTPREAYFVKCDSETTTQADIELGVVNIQIGFAPLKPAEFVIINLRQAADNART
jgi:phage tail sheath protein FI